MKREELYDLHAEMGEDALEIMRAKNVDYASVEDPFRNFRTFGLYGIVVRMSDKIARLQSLVERGVDNNAVKDETYRDTLLDLINYAVIFNAMAVEEQRKAPPVKPTTQLQDIFRLAVPPRLLEPGPIQPAPLERLACADCEDVPQDDEPIVPECEGCRGPLEAPPGMRPIETFEWAPGQFCTVFELTA